MKCNKPNDFKCIYFYNSTSSIRRYSIQILLQQKIDKIHNMQNIEPYEYIVTVLRTISQTFYKTILVKLFVPPDSRKSDIRLICRIQINWIIHCAYLHTQTLYRSFIDRNMQTCDSAHNTRSLRRFPRITAHQHTSIQHNHRCHDLTRRSEGRRWLAYGKFSRKEKENRIG